MTWFGQVSAWMALAMGALFAAGAALRFSVGDFPAAAMLAGALLLMGWYRTWRKMSGGLRLLAGAWGFAAGLLSLMLLLAPVPPAEALLHDTYYVTTPYAWLPNVFLALALLGLALTVLHKESK
ncbi:MAG TPA: hypothetical protein PKY87_03760 [Terricaulis sp.]|nr:hypothetical protein [Terricaulis sp.]